MFLTVSDSRKQGHEPWVGLEAKSQCSGAGRKALVHNLQQMGVLQSSCHPLLICKLLVHWVEKREWCNICIFPPTNSPAPFSITSFLAHKP